jgi:hypothetical protein
MTTDWECTQSEVVLGFAPLFGRRIISRSGVLQTTDGLT